MADELNKGTEIELADGQKVYMKPLTIKQLRKFYKVVKGLDLDGPLEDEQIDVMVDATAIALEKCAPKLAKDKEGLEDLLDMSSFSKILAVAVGADPNE